MRSWFVLIFFGSLLVQIFSRPQQAAEYNNDSDVEEAEEDEENEPVAEEFMSDDDDTRLAQQEPAVQEEDVAQGRHMMDLTESRYLQRNSAEDHPMRTKAENLSDKINQNRDTREDSPEATHSNERAQSYPRAARQPNRYTESNDDQQEATQHLNNRDAYKANRILQGQGENQINKRTVEFEGQTNEEGDILFEKNREQVNKINRNVNNNNVASDTNAQSRYFKQYYNTMQAENRDINEEKSHDGGARYNLRDRRDVKEASPADIPTVSNSQGTKESNDKTDSEDEESAIKRHIKKLSVDELNQLLNSLTDDRRELLKKIIDDVDTSDNGLINKREITKKAGAVEENNFIENCQSDMSKVQGGSPVVESNTEAAPSQNTETTDNSKQPEGATESNDLSSQKTAETSMGSVNNMELTSHVDESIPKTADSLSTLDLNLDPNKNLDKVVANPQVSSKTEIKRETNLDDMNNNSVDRSKTIDNELSLENGQDYANDQGYFSQDESSKLLNDDTQFHQDGKEYKRETDLEKQSELSDSMKSLEDSFPNSNAYDDSAPYSGPLVRVKRKNFDQDIKKRSAGIFPDAKVGYFPYKAENEDEDNDEGNEFDDEGFYDRNSNFANSNKGLEEETASADQSVQAKNSNIDNSKAAPHENLEGEGSMSLGSDTDGVLSGVEGVDDNLMYRNDARNRRTAEGSREVANDETERSILLENDKKSAGENFFNEPRYQENDAFGPLPRNYDGDLNRYKRIRRVKQSLNDQEPTASDD
ncbi:hypothetical protein PYW07_005842 [Mythimna separata]|uniref:EF-hand domain-containing protein n=1 Tax=Mythimna separata TaxID=271217 RepID=A0AAD7YJ18_MYTSE|nr:hypothetical protein PYW07_005842 [Mythimna separata]